MRIFLVHIFFIACSYSHAADIKSMRFWQSPEKTRLVLDVSEPVQYKLFTLNKPNRLVLDIQSSRLTFDIKQQKIPTEIMSRVRTSQKENSTRLVFDLTEKITFKSFVLKPIQNYGHRLVIDIADTRQKSKPPTQVKTSISGERNIVIAIDPGHGGEDPGAIGARGTQEKDIALKVSKEVAKLVNAEKGMQAVMTRKSDYFIRLSKRTEIARDHKADLLVSIHADAFHDRRARGASVWVVSPKGADSEIGRWLEEGERTSQLLGGVEDLSDKDPYLKEVLLDLSKSHTMGASYDVAGIVYKQLSKVVPKMHGKRVQKAAFVVLKMPDIPAILVETAFISNREEEKLLRSARYRKKVAKAVFRGIKQYFHDNPPDGSLLATIRDTKKRTVTYVVKRGDTLSEIAEKFNVTMSQIKQHNQLKSSMVRIGQKLKIVGQP